MTPDQSSLPESALQLQKFALDNIPLARAMQLRLHTWQDDRLVLRAPLAPNINDKGCAFGGSLASLMTIAPWALLELNLRQAGVEADIFVADATIRYRAPIFEDIEVLATPAEGERLSDFRDILAARGRARMTLEATVHAGGQLACQQTGRYVAKLRQPGGSGGK